MARRLVSIDTTEPAGSQFESDTNDAVNDEILKVVEDADAYVPKSLFTQKGDIIVRNAAGDLVALHVGDDGEAVVADATQDEGIKYGLPGGAGTSYGQNLGPAAPGDELTVTHNLGTLNFGAVVRRNPGHPSNYGLDHPAQIVWVDVIPVDVNMAIVIPDETWETNQYRIEMVAYATGDTTAPTVPTVALSSKTSNSITVNATGSTDAVGVSLYEWYKDGVVVTQTTGNSFVFSGLAASTSYVLGCKTIDLQGNKSTLGTATISTNALAVATFVLASSGSVASVASSNTQTATDNITVDAGDPDAELFVLLLASHNWWKDPATDYAVYSVSSDRGSSFSEIARVGIGPAGQIEGSIGLFKCDSPATGLHNITAQITATTPILAGTIDQLRILCFYYKNVASVSAPVTQTDAGGGGVTLNVTVTGATNDRALLVLGNPNPAVTGFNKTSRASAGSNVTGKGDFLLVGDAAGAASNTFTTSSSQQLGAIGVNLVHA